MAIYDLKANLDLKQNMNIYATCKQLDNLNLILYIYDNSVQVDLSSYTVRLKAMKADKVPLVQEHTGISISGNIITIETDEQLTTTSGKTLIELQFIDNSTGKKKATFNLVLIVIASTLADGTTISKSTYTLLEELENKMDQASNFFENIDEAITANNNLQDSIYTGNTLKTNLDNNITTGNTLNNDLETNISAGNILKPNLEGAVTSANTAKAELDISIQDANTFVSEHGDIIDLDNRVTQNTSQLNDNTQKIITPEMFGAVGDGITDDFEALNKCFMYSSDVVIRFAENKIYSIDSVGIECTYDNITVMGNGSTIKISDNNVVLQKIFNSEGKEKDRTLLTFLGNNIEISKLYLDANNDNNYILYNNEKFYGYQKDIEVELPNSPDYLTIDGIIAKCNNFRISNSSFNGFGNAIQCGGTWGSNDKRYNYEINSCLFTNGFRDQLTCCDGENISVYDCIFTDNQRKGIQLYRNFNNAIIKNVKISNNTDNIRMWYPTWDKSNADSELSGIGITNPGYEDNCNFVSVIDCTIDVYKVGIAIRNYSKNISLKNNVIITDDVCINIHKGVLNNLEILSNKLIGSIGINSYLGNIDTDYSSENTIINIENNTFNIKTSVYRFLHDDIDSKVLNKCYLYIKNNNYEGSKRYYLQDIGQNAINLEKYYYVYDYDNILSFKNYYYIKKENIVLNKNMFNFKTSSRTSSDGTYYKIGNIAFKEVLGRLTLTGEIASSSGEKFAYSNFFIGIRVSYIDLSNQPLVQLYTYNNISTDKYSISCVFNYSAENEVLYCDVYVKVPDTVTGSNTIKIQETNIAVENSIDYNFNLSENNWLVDIVGERVFNSEDV